MLKYFICPDSQQIETYECIKFKGCRLQNRCAPLAYLRSISEEREWRGITASMAGNGPRLVYLQRITDCAITPDSMAFAVLGIKSHAWLGREKVTKNVLSEEKMQHGTPDCLEEDENNQGMYILYDYKTWGSYKVAKAQGIVKGDTKGTFKINPKIIDIKDVQLQVNQYRIDWEKRNFPISKMYIFAIIRDGGTYIAKGRGILTNTQKIEIPKLPNSEVETYYKTLEEEVEQAVKNNYCRRCNSWESWEGRRCNGYCDVKNECDKMDEIGKELKTL